MPERINEFLVRCAGRAYCDHCIQERLGLRWRQQVQLVTATLGVTSGYSRSTAICSTCAESKQVITYVTPSQIAKPMLKLPTSAVRSPTKAKGDTLYSETDRSGEAAAVPRCRRTAEQGERPTTPIERLLNDVAINRR
ncbi:hypothetical protein XH98_37320 [Bradyrhizobium sp. CCBAU 51745]|uniref:hypothetical protein n=1 Tax=Bradyrhizobium sp. BR 10261 TaxID=2749992 RepID=UPI001C646315|nr:hypothetical protein [Bradyrhizobium sp. BR 10261]MBW7961793.1 hypothetical protein [Bradyrhizobium sp. BR 10261]MDA9444631.1 hypothetical protein [Bradyrhizobium sp. CCBAU 51745]